MNEERKKSNATEKRYAKHVGKLFWEREQNWDYDTKTHTYSYALVIVISLGRRWGRGRFEYMLHQPGSKNDWRQEYRYSCADFERQLRRGIFLPVEPGNPNPPIYKEF